MTRGCGELATLFSSETVADAPLAPTLHCVTATADYYGQLLETFLDTESLTVLVVAGATVSDVVSVLEVDLSGPVDLDDVIGGEDGTAWALLAVPGGVLAIEPTGFGDPTRTALVELSCSGRAAAVARSNVLAHVRFGCARDGALIFDDNEYMYARDPSVVPDELRALFDLVWDDLSGEPDGEDDDEGPDGLSVSMAMAEAVTGIEITAVQVETLLETDFHSAPSQQYADELSS